MCSKTEEATLGKARASKSKPQEPEAKTDENTIGTSVENESTENKKGNSQENLIDGLRKPENFQNSREITAAVRKHKGNISLKYAYPLHRAGIAVTLDWKKLTC